MWLLQVIVHCCLMGSVQAETVQGVDSSPRLLRIWQSSPGTLFNDSFLIGNGRIGAAVKGGVPQDVIQVNENSLWSGGPMNRNNQDAASTVAQMQPLIVQGNPVEAEKLASFGYASTPQSTRQYDVLGTLTLQMDHGKNFTDYERYLDLSTGITGVQYNVSGVTYVREYLASYPDDVIAIRVEASQPVVSFSIRLDRGTWLNRWQDYAQHLGSDTIIMGGSSGGNQSIEFVAGVKVVSRSGIVRAIGDNVLVSNTSEATVYFDARTNFRENDPLSATLNNLATVTTKDYDNIRMEHVSDYQALAGRVALSLGALNVSYTELTTTERFEQMNSTGAFDPGLATQYWHLARHLLICSSREGTKPLPPNLQGLWSNDFDPDWGSKYTININLEMNYWPALPTNLAELTAPLYSLLKYMRSSGNETARNMYRASGLVAHHNTDLWGDTSPQDNVASATIWPMGATWLLTHVMEHYRFTGDKSIIEDMYPLVHEACIFATGFLSDYQGYKVTNPTVSPENSYYVQGSDTESASVTAGSTLDNALLRELFGMAIEMRHILGYTDDGAEAAGFSSHISSLRDKLPPYRVSQYGTLAEWIHDYNETDPGHRHFSHLFGLFPGSDITSASDTDIFNASHASLTRRLSHSGGSTGWSRAWSIALAARCFDTAEVHNSTVQQLLQYTYPSSMLDTGPPAPFQIDGNFGAPAGMVEAMLQSHEAVSLANTTELRPAFTGDVNKAYLIRLLPALPTQWAVNGGGYVSGLLARGGFEVHIAWNAAGGLKQAKITSKLGGATYITLGSATIGSDDAQLIEISGQGTGSFVLLNSTAGETYEVRPTSIQ